MLLAPLLHRSTFLRSLDTHLLSEACSTFITRHRRGPKLGSVPHPTNRHNFRPTVDTQGHLAFLPIDSKPRYLPKSTFRKGRSKFYSSREQIKISSLFLQLPGADQNRFSISIRSRAYVSFRLAEKDNIGNEFPVIGTVYERSVRGRLRP